MTFNNGGLHPVSLVSLLLHISLRFTPPFLGIFRRTCWYLHRSVVAKPARKVTGCPGTQDTRKCGDIDGTNRCVSRLNVSITLQTFEMSTEKCCVFLRSLTDRELIPTVVYQSCVSEIQV